MNRFSFRFPILLLVLLCPHLSWAQATTTPDTTQTLLPEAWRTWQPYQPPAIPDTVRWLWSPEDVRQQGTLSPTRWLVTDPLADEYPSWSPYNYVMNNPLIFIDPDGMDIDLSGLYERDEDGNLLNRPAVEAFELWASTEEGQAYLALFAQAGFVLEGAVISDLNLSFDTEGILSQNGIDFSAIATDISSYEPYSSIWGGDPAGFTHATEVEGRLQVNVVFDRKDPGWPNTSANRMHNVDTWAHESMYHGYAEAMQFLDPSSNINRLSTRHSENLFFASPYGSYRNHVLSNSMGLGDKSGIPAVNIIMQVQVRAGLTPNRDASIAIVNSGWPRKIIR